MLKKIASVFFAVSMLFASAGAVQAADYLVLDTDKGRVTIRLRNDLAPLHVERIKTLTQEGFYNGAPFHRVIEGFMAQTGDPTGTGTGKSNYPDLKAEFTSTPFARGTVGMARTMEHFDTANSQFFICFNATPQLDGSYTVIGEVTEGMQVVDSLNKGVGRSGMVPKPSRIIKATLKSN